MGLRAHGRDLAGHIVNVGDSSAGSGYPTSGLLSTWERTEILFVTSDYAGAVLR